VVEASRRRRASPGKPESRRGKKKERGNPPEEERDDSELKWEMRKNEGAVDGLAGASKRGNVGQIKEKMERGGGKGGRRVRERTFGTSSRTKSNFGPMAKLSYFPRNMHARGRAQVFPATFSGLLPFDARAHSRPYERSFNVFARVASGMRVYSKWLIKFPSS